MATKACASGRWKRELRGLLEQDRPLRVYLGIDPTASSLTLGHTVPLRKLRQFQDVRAPRIFLIGDYTALIGDPSDKNKLRPMLTPEDIAATSRPTSNRLRGSSTRRKPNCATTRVAGRADLPGHHLADVEVHRCRDAPPRKLPQPLGRSGDAVYLHEFLYALMQGYDAYALECDVQVGGTEQLFNLMAGRKIQEDAGQKPHVPVTMPILVGLDGKERMSKSKGNHIGVNDSPASSSARQCPSRMRRSRTSSRSPRTCTRMKCVRFWWPCGTANAVPWTQRSCSLGRL
jgi:tyrosyl-tRNA synthetase